MNTRLKVFMLIAHTVVEPASPSRNVLNVMVRGIAASVKVVVNFRALVRGSSIVSVIQPVNPVNVKNAQGLVNSSGYVINVEVLVKSLIQTA